MADPVNRVLVSAATIWELSIKQAAGRLEPPEDLVVGVAALGFDEVPVEYRHAVAAAQLPLHHRDPFDRMLVAQAVVEGLTLVTRDRRIRRYDVPVLWD